MGDGDQHWVDVRDKPAFLHRLMTELAGNAHMSLEGDLSQCRWNEELVVVRNETPILKRNTRVPTLDFVVLALTPECVAPVLQQVMGAGLKRAIIHLQIERNGVLELGAYDNFDPDCVVTGPGISQALLQELKNKNILRDFEVAQPGRRGL